VHDNAKEFLNGEFTQICADEGIQQICNPPYTPNHNQNPTEHYMEIITSTMRALFFVSGLNPTEFWEHALQHAINLQLHTALPGRCTPYELTHGRRPNVLNLRIFGCEALAYIEKDTALGSHECFAFWRLLFTGHETPDLKWRLLFTGHETPDLKWRLLFTGHERPVFK
jgi:hypothetical protein